MYRIVSIWTGITDIVQIHTFVYGVNFSCKRHLQLCNKTGRIAGRNEQEKGRFQLNLIREPIFIPHCGLPLNNSLVSHTVLLLSVHGGRTYVILNKCILHEFAVTNTHNASLDFRCFLSYFIDVPHSLT